MNWTSKHNENPVKIIKGILGFHIYNEGCDDLVKPKTTRQEAVEWCHKHGCRPIPSSWKQFNLKGYKR